MNTRTEYIMLIIFSIICVFGILGSLYLYQLVFDECKADGKSDLYCMKVSY